VQVTSFMGRNLEFAWRLKTLLTPSQALRNARNLFCGEEFVVKSED